MFALNDIKCFILGILCFSIIACSSEKKAGDQKTSSLFFQSQMPSEFSNFQYYGTPKLLQIDSSTLQISSDNHSKHGGLELNFKLDHSKPYALLISGKSLEGTTSLRLSQDNRFSWLPTPNKLSDNLFVINNTDKLQLLFCSNNKFSYQLKHLTIHEIDKFKTDADLKRKILTDNPGLDKLLKGDKLNAAKIILDWTANHLVYANDSESQHNTLHLSASAMYYELFNKQLGGVYCDGAADFFTKICHLFNIDAFTIGLGVQSTPMTHSISIVPVKHHESYDYYLFDPTFNLILTDKVTHQLVSINTLINSKVNLKKKIHIHVGDISKRRYLVTKKVSGTSPLLKHEFTNYTNQSYKKYAKENEKAFKKYHILSDNYLIINLLPYLFIVEGGLSPDAENDFKKLLHPLVSTQNKSEIHKKKS